MVSPAIKRFLQDFGGLKMKCNCRYRSNSPDEVDFYIYEMDAILARNSVTEVQEQMQITICPIRRCSDRDMLLYMDADGKLYANEDGYICFVGKDVPEAFDNLVVGKELEELYEQE